MSRFPRSRTSLRRETPVIGYVTAPAGASDDEIRARERAMVRGCERGGWRLVAIIGDRDEGPLLARPGMGNALERIASGRARGLVVADARLLSRSPDFAMLVDQLVAADATLIALDLGLDTSTPE